MQGKTVYFLFIALGRMVTFCKEGGGMLLIWALRARSYKTRAEAWQQGIALHPLQGVFLVFVLLPVRGFKKFKNHNKSLGLGWLVACLIFSLIMVGLYKLLWSTVLTCYGRPTRGAVVDRPSTLWSTDQRPLERCRTELNENWTKRPILEQF